MPAICDALPTQGSFAPGLVSYLDCQAQSLGSQGYQALAAPGSTVSLLLTGMIALLIAVLGYRLLLGETLTLRDGVLTFVKIGLVLALATAWPAYQVLIYDVVLRGPAELAESIGGAAGLPGATGGLAARLDAIDQALQSLAITGVGSFNAEPGAEVPMNIAPPPFLGFDGWALGWSRVGFLVGAVGSFAIVRILAGIMLALGPLFLLFLLFDGTRGLVSGWGRALLFCLIGSLAISLVLGIELGLLEPWLASLLARRASGLDVVGAPAQLLATTVIFNIALGSILVATGVVASGLRLPAWSRSPGSTFRQSAAAADRQLSSMRADQSLPNESRSRASAVADAVAVTQRREEAAAAYSLQSVTVAGGISSGGQRYPSMLPSGGGASTTRRRVGTRVSARARTRDRSK
jgi:type IV secretion system protein VirB6